MSRWPLRWRIPTIAVSLVVVAELIIGGAAVLILDRIQIRQADQRLDQVVAEMQQRPGILLAQGGPTATVDDVRPASDVLVAVFREDGTLAEAVTLRANNGRAIPEVRVAEEVERPYTARAQGELWRVRVATIGNDATLVVFLPLTDARAASRVLASSVAILAAVTAALGAVAAWWATRRSLRPLEQARATAASIAAGVRGARVPVGHERTEAGSLATSMNLMLDRLDESFAAQEAVQERLRRFLADASHELRTPLAAIQGYAELQHMGADVDGTATERIAANAARMGALVDDLLALARSDESPGALAGHERVDLAALVEDVAADLRAQDSEREVSVTAPDPVVVQGSTRHLRQVLANIGGNVLTHTPAGTAVDLVARTEGDRAVVTVRDHGPGFGAHAGDVFRRFYRADPARARDTGGAGLGLSIVAAIVADHGGSVSAADAPGGGGVVEVKVPLASSAA